MERWCWTVNILHMKYAVEVAKAGSLNKASETLYVALPNVSRSIRELEADLGITIFDRSAKGVTLTPEGEEFIGYAKEILKQIEHVEMLYRDGGVKKQKFSISVPRASYISYAFADFSAPFPGMLPRFSIRRPTPSAPSATFLSMTTSLGSSAMRKITTNTSNPCWRRRALSTR